MLALASLLRFAAAPSAQDTAPTYVISARLVDESGGPLLTDADGRFRLANEEFDPGDEPIRAQLPSAAGSSR